MTRTLSLLALLLYAALAAGCRTTPDAATPPGLVVLVRHAEKDVRGRDPALTAAGAVRAAELAAVLADAGIERVHSTDTARTRTTAEPLAVLLGVPVELYDPRALGAFAAGLRAGGGRHLVVGHSNTTPALVELLGGDPGAPIEEAGEYDRLYLVPLGAGPESLLLRYGAH